MFEHLEETNKPDRKVLWRVIPLAALVFAVIIGIFVFFAFDKPSVSATLSGVLRKGDPNFDWYEKYVTIEQESQKIQLGTNYAGDKIVMFSGVINNGGEKTLDVVEVKVVLFNYEEPVWETIRVPIRPEPRISPIPPLGRRSFSVYVESLPEAWNAGQAEMWIHGFRFVDNGR